MPKSKGRNVGYKIVLMVAVLSLTFLLTPMPAYANHIPYAAGDVFAGVGAGKVNHYSSTGVLIEVLDTTTGSAEQTGMCFDASGNLYTTDWTAGKVSKFDNMGGLLVASWGGPFSSHPETCVVDNAGNIYVGEVDGLNKIRKFDSAGTLLDSWSPAGQSRGTDWMDLSADQCTMLYTSEGSLVKRFNVCTNSQLADFASGLPAPCYALRIRTNGEVLVACSSAVKRLDATGAVIQTYTTASIGVLSSFLFAMNLDPDGTTFWTGAYGTGAIRRVDIASGAVVTSFTATIVGSSMAGLAIFGEIVVGCPTCGVPVPEFGMAASLMTALATIPIIGLRQLRSRKTAA